MHISFKDLVTDALLNFMFPAGEPLTQEGVQALHDEIRKGHEIERQRAFHLQAEIARSNAKAEHRSVDCLGQCTARIHPLLAEVLKGEFPNTEERDQFLKRRFGSVFLQPRYQTKARIIHPGMPRAQQDHMAALAAEAANAQPSILAA